MFEAPTHEALIDFESSAPNVSAAVRRSPAALEIVAKVNHGDRLEIARVGERRTFELPAVIWLSMVASYSVFLAALLVSTGGLRAGFAIAVSAIYIAMFFGTARMIMRQGPPQGAAPIGSPGTVLQTAFGPMSRSAVFGQILIVPIAVAVFGLAIAIIIAVVV